MVNAIDTLQNRRIQSPRDVMGPIGVIVLDLPQMVREIVTGAVNAEADMTVAAEIDDPAAVAAAVPYSYGPLVLVGGSDMTDEQASRMLGSLPRGAIVTISAVAGSLESIELRPIRVPLGDEWIVAAIRAAAAVQQ